MFQPKTESAIMQGVQQFGPGPGGKKMMLWEFTHATEGNSSFLDLFQCFIIRIHKFSKYKIIYSCRVRYLHNVEIQD